MTQPMQQPPSYPPQQPYQQPYRGPAKAAHGGGYWAMVGWWWEPLKWLGRMSLWVLFFPVGIWRSARHGRKNREARMRRGYQG